MPGKQNCDINFLTHNQTVNGLLTSQGFPLAAEDEVE